LLNFTPLQSQIDDERNRQQRQNALFSKAKKIFNPIMRNRHSMEGTQIEHECDEEENATQRRYQIQDENLALEMR